MCSKQSLRQPADAEARREAMIQTHAQVLIHGSGATRDGTISYHAWSLAERKARARKKTFKIIGTILAVSSLGLFAHLLLPIFLALDFLTLLTSAFLYMRFFNEEATFLHVDGACPHCGAEGRLKPYLNTRYTPEVTVQCPACGQTSRAETRAGT